MCGIAGFIDQGLPFEEKKRILIAMLNAIAHRGPDDTGIYLRPEVALGHRRLAIVDLSPTGHQPMRSASGRYMIVFNGEIYNHVELRWDLSNEGVQFNGKSDTETFLALMEIYGFQEAIKRCVGMFAIAVWDLQLQLLFLARDRLGEKPLYLAESGSRLFFASELKALRSITELTVTINPHAVYDLLTYGYVRAPDSIWQEINQIEPGFVYEFSLTRNGITKKATQYWSVRNVVLNAVSAPFQGSFKDAVDEVTRRLSESVRLTMQADVPLGAFLSGGIDSSLITALMQRQASQKVKTYSIGFYDSKLNEASYAKAVAHHLGTEHTEWYVDESEIIDLIPDLPHFYDEPLADSSQLPTIILAKLTRKDVTVALSGDGADEIFGGYPKYWQGQNLLNRPGRTLAGCAAGFFDQCISGVLDDYKLTTLEKLIPLHRIKSFASLYAVQSSAEFIDALNRINRNALDYISRDLRPQLDTSFSNSFTGLNFQRQAMLMDVVNYLPCDILVKVDRATMAASLESRAPFLDHRLFEFAASLPNEFLFAPKTGKHVLRESLKGFVPAELIDRPKSGFSPPIGKWLRGSLREWARDTLSDPLVAEILDLTACRRLLTLHCESKFDLSARLWPMLSLAHWYRQQKS